MTTQLVKDAFQMAWRLYHPKSSLLFHSDRGSQYTSLEFQRLLRVCHVKASMSGTGNCYDNSVVESFSASLKIELIYQTVYSNQEEAMTDIFFYIEGFYNRQRRHSALGYLSPMAYEASYQLQMPAR
jgi:putative transposase